MYDCNELHYMRDAVPAPLCTTCGITYELSRRNCVCGAYNHSRSGPASGTPSLWVAASTDAVVGGRLTRTHTIDDPSEDMIIIGHLRVGPYLMLITDRGYLDNGPFSRVMIGGLVYGAFKALIDTVQNVLPRIERERELILEMPTADDADVEPKFERRFHPAITTVAELVRKHNRDVASVGRVRYDEVIPFNPFVPAEDMVVLSVYHTNIYVREVKHMTVVAPCMPEEVLRMPSRPISVTTMFNTAMTVATPKTATIAGGATYLDVAVAELAYQDGYKEEPNGTFFDGTLRLQLTGTMGPSNIDPPSNKHTYNSTITMLLGRIPSV